ncbi:MAG TPA: prolyl oligopeptidase family serine peptidase [Thermoanaerobaculia bacterium]|nr:prolyl oligopeptidase family serine peptidase [Thermoanaerobaculia bacterium]
MLKITMLALLLASCATQPAPRTASVATPAVPVTEARPAREVLHGVEISDPYQWLEDQEAPATREWISRQNAYTDAILGPRPEPGIFAARLEQLMTTDKISAPHYRNGRFFFLRRAIGEDQASLYLRDRKGKEERLIDPAPMSPDHTVSVGIYDITPDGKLLAYSVRKGGADEVEIRFYDTDARRDIGEPLARERFYTVNIAPNNDVYYTRRTAAGPRTFRRPLTGGREHELFGSGYGPEKLIYSALSEDGRYLLVNVLHGSAPKKTEIYVDDLRDAAPPQTVVNDLDFRTFGEMAGDSIVLHTNWNAPNDRVMVASAAAPGRGQWREIVPENPKAAIQSTSLAGGRVYVKYLEEVKPRLIGYDLEGNRKDDVAFPTLGNLSDMSGTWTSPVAFFGFSSFHVPNTIYQYDVATGGRSVFTVENAPVKPDDFTVEQVWYPSKDGTRVPMFLLSRKGVQRNGANPVFLTGYGGFTSSMTPSFSAKAIAWVEQGGIYAVPNLRGGGEFGEAWHRAGMQDTKQNTFDDFIAAAEYLVRERYTSPRHIAIAGGSNGGLLVMAAAMQRPDLFGAVVCRYPLIDMLRYHKFLVGSFWVPEYGDPAKAEEFQWVYAYSPYHKVKQGTKYPATLFITGDADTRVAPLHARKMTALMQAQAGNGPEDPILLRYHIAGGHAGGEPLAVQVKNAAEELGFVWWQVK